MSGSPMTTGERQDLGQNQRSDGVWTVVKVSQTMEARSMVHQAEGETFGPIASCALPVTAKSVRMTQS